MSFYQRLQNLAKDKGISFREIEENLDYPKNTLYSYKTKDPSGKRLVELSRYFGVSTDYLLGEDSVQRVIKTETHLSGKESKAIHANVLFENLAQANSVVLYAMLNEKNNILYYYVFVFVFLPENSKARHNDSLPQLG